MERTKYVNTKHKVLKTIAIILLLIVSIALVFLIIYSRFGIAGIFQNKLISGILGLNKQQMLPVPTVSNTEISEIINKLGYDPAKEEISEMKSKRNLDFSLSPQATTYLINSLIKDKEVVENLQISTTNDNKIELSAIANIDTISKMVGESKESIENSIGELPDKVPVYAKLSSNYNDNNSSISSIKVGQLEIPESIYTSINGYVDEGLELFFENALGVDLEDFTIKDNMINLTGEFPSP